ncbi:MAG TPA: histidine phosphatase family protein [Haloplasmataceae bacterium]
MLIHLIRHAETIDNVSKIIQGQQDSKLTEKGIIQTKILAKYLAKFDIDKIYSSPQLRAKETALIIASYLQNKDIITLDELKEIHLASWEKRYEHELLVDKDNTGFFVYKNNPGKFTPKCGEDFSMVQARMLKAIDYIIKENKEDKEILVVSHSTAIRTLLLAIENKTFDTIWDYKIYPSSITTLKYHMGKFWIERIGYIPENKEVDYENIIST